MSKIWAEDIEYRGSSIYMVLDVFIDQINTIRKDVIELKTRVEKMEKSYEPYNS